MSSAADVVETSVRQVARLEVEDFLYEEAALLSARRFDDWLALFEEGGRYEIPTSDGQGGDPRLTQYYIADDWELLQARVIRLKSRNAHAENPPSTTHRLISNVRLTEASGDSLSVEAVFIVHRIRDGRVDQYLGRYEHLLAVTDAGLRFRRRRTLIDVEQLRPAGRLSFVL